MTAQTTDAPEPSVITAGDSVEWLLSLADYPADSGWSASYALVSAAGRITFASSADGSDHRVTLTAAATATWAPGRYRMVTVLTKDDQRNIINYRDIEVLPDPVNAAPWDTTTHAERTLVALEAWIEQNDLAVATFKLADREIQHIDMSELLRLRSAYRAEVRRERAARSGVGIINRLQVRV